MPRAALFGEGRLPHLPSRGMALGLELLSSAWSGALGMMQPFHPRHLWSQSGHKRCACPSRSRTRRSDSTSLMARERGACPAEKGLFRVACEWSAIEGRPTPGRTAKLDVHFAECVCQSAGTPLGAAVPGRSSQLGTGAPVSEFHDKRGEDVGVWGHCVFPPADDPLGATGRSVKHRPGPRLGTAGHRCSASDRASRKNHSSGSAWSLVPRRA